MKFILNMTLYFVFFCIPMSCSMNDSVESITFDYWRWDKWCIYHVALDEQIGYMSKKSLECDTDSVQSSIILPNEEVSTLYEYATKSYIPQDSTPPHQKKKVDRFDYHMPIRLEIVIRCGRHSIKDTLFIPTIDDYEYDYSNDFNKLLNFILPLTDDY